MKTGSDFRVSATKMIGAGSQSLGSLEIVAALCTGVIHRVGEVTVF
jgi:hypothetical protein